MSRMRHLQRMPNDRAVTEREPTCFHELAKLDEALATGAVTIDQ
jgi:hypothetical protein